MNNAEDILNVLKKEKPEKELFPFLEYYPSPAFIINENFEILQANHLAQNLIGNKSEKLNRTTALNLFSGNKSSAFKDLFNSTLQNCGNNTTEVIIKKDDGSNINCLAMLKCFKWGDNKNKYCSLALIDFTTQKMNEEILKQSQIRFKNLANTAPVMIWIADLNGLFSFVNNVWLDFTGSEPGEQLGMNWLRNVHPIDFERILNGYQKAVTSITDFSFEFRLMRADKNYEWVLLRGKPRYSTENIHMGFIGSCISINEQKEIEAKVSKLNEELVELNTTKDKFFSIISHDLRGPLGGLMGILEIMENSYQSISEDEKLEIISEASKSAKSTFNLMENLLEWARIQSGKIKCQPENLKLTSIIGNIVSIFDQ
ncbi:MAG: PAS domain S-box protein, partial [Nitrososphaeraceae archaeon]|nr:PAS domain S-box protein [Nitrososphaeraceae archaeon]